MPKPGYETAESRAAIGRKKERESACPVSRRGRLA